MYTRTLTPALFICIAVGLTACSKKQITPTPPIKKESDAIVTTLAGNGTYGSSNGTGAAATFAYPDAICTDALGNIYVGDGGDYLIRKVTPGGTVTTVPNGEVVKGQGGLVAGIGGLTVDPSGTFYYTFELGSALFKLSPGGTSTLVAGAGLGDVDGPGDIARFSNLIGLTCDAQGNVYGCDFENFKVRKITPSGDVSTVLGTGAYVAPGIDTTGFLSLQSIALGKDGNFYVTDPDMYRVTKLLPSGRTVFMAGMSYPAGIAVDASGNVYVSDMLDHVINRISQDGTVTLIAGTKGKRGYKDGIGKEAQFALPQSLALDPTGKILYVADAGNSVIRKIVLPQ
ncbi:MAG TPA: hypothetical protein VGN20_06525 [Mucilaginibacter sp.]